MGIKLTTPTIYGLEGRCLFHSSLFGLGSFPDSIQHDFIRVWKSETGKEWQIGWVGKALEF